MNSRSSPEFSLNWIFFFRQKAWLRFFGNMFLKKYFLGLKRPHFWTRWHLRISEFHSNTAQFHPGKQLLEAFVTSGLFATTPSGFSEQTGRKGFELQRVPGRGPHNFMVYPFPHENGQKIGLVSIFLNKLYYQVLLVVISHIISFIIPHLDP